MIEVDYEFLMRDIQVGDRVTIGDGGAVLEVTDKKADKMLANVVAGSTLEGVQVSTSPATVSRSRHRLPKTSLRSMPLSMPAST